MSDVSLQFTLGSVGGHFGQLAFTFVVSSNREAYIQARASDPSNLRRSGILLLIIESDYRRLKELCTATDEVITKLKASGHMSSMSWPDSMSVSMQVNLGSLESHTGRMAFTLVVQNNKSGHLQLYASDPTNRRKSGVVVICSEIEFQHLKQVIQKTDDLIVELSASNQMDQLKLTG